MIGLKVRTVDRTDRVKKKAKDASFKSLGHAGAAIRLTARRSIRKGAKESSPGTPPHTRKGQLKRAIVYAVEKREERAVIGPEHAVVGLSAMAHEFGGRFRGDRYDKRPFMGPALMKVKDRLPRKWAGSVR
ncbi:MAG: hypothetical protein AB7F75_00785 [Planctomycetota bacterium]